VTLRSSAAVLLFALGVAACSTGGTSPTASSTDPGSPGTTSGTATTAATTTTADLNRVCGAVASDAADLLGDLLEELEGLTSEQVADPGNWPPELAELQRRGEELDEAAAAAGCDPAAIQGVALAEAAEADPQARIPQILLEVLSVP
jgi:hypothetical protein